MLTKTYVKSRQVCKVKFEVPQDELPEDVEVERLALVGDFNDWDPQATPMPRRRGGIYRVLVEFEPGSEHQYRYLINGERWYNDWHADAYVPNGVQGDNCVVAALSGPQ